MRGISCIRLLRRWGKESFHASLVERLRRRQTTGVTTRAFLGLRLPKGTPFNDPVRAVAVVIVAAAHSCVYSGEAPNYAPLEKRLSPAVSGHQQISLPHAANFSLGLSPARTAKRTSKSILNRSILPRFRSDTRA